MTSASEIFSPLCGSLSASMPEARAARVAPRPKMSVAAVASP